MRYLMPSAIACPLALVVAMDLYGVARPSANLRGTLVLSLVDVVTGTEQ